MPEFRAQLWKSWYLEKLLKQKKLLHLKMNMEKFQLWKDSMQYRDTYTGMHLQCSEMSYECLMTIEEAICTFMSINSVTFFSITVGLGAFIYHERYVNKPHTLDDGFSDSGGCSTSVDDSIGRVSHIDCSGLDIPTVSSFLSSFFKSNTQHSTYNIIAPGATQSSSTSKGTSTN